MHILIRRKYVIAKRHRGVAMVLVLIALAMATVIGLSFLNTQATTTGIARNVGNQTRARGIAESAMEMAIDHLRTNNTWRSDKAQGTWASNQALDGGTFSLIVQDGVINASGNVVGDGDLSDEVTDHVVVTAVGYFKGVAHTIRAEITPEAGDATPAKVVLVVGNSLQLNAQEASRRAQLIDWGYEVTLVSASASQSTFNDLAEENEVFLISESISSGSLNSKLRDVGAGVVNEERALYDDFRLTSGDASEYNDTRIEVIDNTHAITTGMDMGVVAVFGSTQHMQYVGSGSLPNGARVLANNPNNDEPALIIVESGSALQSGSAAGRRVFLPWATNALDFGALNTSGLNLLKRCIDWAAAKPTSPAPVLHYDFSEQAGDLIHDKYGNADMQLDRGDDSDAITWVTDANGMGIQFSQDPEEGTAVCITSSPTDCDDLANAIRQTNAVTVQVYFKQLNGSSNGGYLLSMANMAVEDDTEPGSGGSGSSGSGRHGRSHHGGGHGHGGHHGHHSINEQVTYTESFDITQDPDTVIFYSNNGGNCHNSSNGRSGWSRRSCSRSDSYRVCYSRDRGYYYRRCGDGGDDEDEIPEDAPDLFDNFCIAGTPSGNGFNHNLYMSHDEGDVDKDVNGAWNDNTPVVYAFTYDSEDGVVRIYINGTQVATENAPDSGLENWVSQWLSLGNSPSLSRPFVGTIYDVKIWSGKLSQSQLKDNADALLDNADGNNSPKILVLYEFDEVDPIAPQLISQWKLNETTGISSGGALYGTGASADSDFTLKDGAQIDGYRSTSGNYGGSNARLNVNATVNSTSSDKFEIKDSGTKLYGNALCGKGGNANSVVDVSDSAQLTGSKAAQTANVVLPESITPPTSGKPSYAGNVEYKNGSPGTLGSNLYAGNFTVKSSYDLTISGNVTIWCSNFEVKDSGTRIYVPNGSSLTVYATGNLTVKDGAQINYQNSETNGAARVNMFTVDGGNLEIKDSSTVVVGNMYSTGHFTLKDSAKLYGTAASSDDIEIKDSNTRLYVDLDQVGGSGSGSGGSNTTTAADEKSVSDGTYTNGPVTEDDGKFGSAISFDGSDDYVVMDHNDAYLINTGMITFWFKAADLTGTQALFSKDSSGYDNGGHLTIYLDGSTLKARLQSTTASYTVSEAGISSDTWYHAAFSFGPAGMKLILNGSIVDTNAYTGSMGTTSGGSGNAEPIVIGAGSMDSGNQVATPVGDYFHGLIDDVRIYGSPLTTTQITTVMADGHPDVDSAVGLVVKDTGGYGEPLDMTVVDPEYITWDDHGGMNFTGPSRVVSDTPATKITDALNASGAMTIEIIYTPDNVEQDGNIASISSSSYSRNMAIAQDDEKDSVSIRTSSTDNSAAPAVESGDVLTNTQQHLVITWDGSVMKVYRNGQLESTTNHDGDLSNWSDSMYLVFGNEYDGSKPWEGFLERFAIYNQALNSLQVEDVFNGEAPRDNTQTQAMAFHVRWYENP